MRFYQLVAVAGPMPDGGTNRVEIAVCSIPALLAMKGHALAGRYKQKDAYDVYYCIRNYPASHSQHALHGIYLSTRWSCPPSTCPAING